MYTNILPNKMCSTCNGGSSSYLQEQRARHPSRSNIANIIQPPQVVQYAQQPIRHVSRHAQHRQREVQLPDNYNSSNSSSNNNYNNNGNYFADRAAAQNNVQLINATSSNNRMINRQRNVQIPNNNRTTSRIEDRIVERILEQVIDNRQQHHSHHDNGRNNRCSSCNLCKNRCDCGQCRTICSCRPPCPPNCCQPCCKPACPPNCCQPCCKPPPCPPNCCKPCCVRPYGVPSQFDYQTFQPGQFAYPQQGQFNPYQGYPQQPFVNPNNFYNPYWDYQQCFPQPPPCPPPPCPPPPCPPPCNPCAGVRYPDSLGQSYTFGCPPPSECGCQPRCNNGCQKSIRCVNSCKCGNC